MGWWTEHGLSSMDAVPNILWVSVPPSVWWASLRGYGSCSLSQGKRCGYWFPSTHSSLRSASPPVIPISDGHIKSVVWAQSISNYLFLEVDAKEVGGEGLAVGPVVPASQPPGDTNLVFFMLFPSSCTRWESWVERPFPPLHSCC